MTQNLQETNCSNAWNNSSNTPLQQRSQPDIYNSQFDLLPAIIQCSRRPWEHWGDEVREARQDIIRNCSNFGSAEESYRRFREFYSSQRGIISADNLRTMQDYARTIDLGYFLGIDFPNSFSTSDVIARDPEQETGIASFILDTREILVNFFDSLGLMMAYENLSCGNESVIAFRPQYSFLHPLSDGAQNSKTARRYQGCRLSPQSYTGWMLLNPGQWRQHPENTWEIQISLPSLEQFRTHLPESLIPIPNYHVCYDPSNCDGSQEPLCYSSGIEIPFINRLSFEEFFFRCLRPTIERNLIGRQGESEIRYEIF